MSKQTTPEQPASEQQLPSKEDVLKFLQEQIEVKKLQAELQELNTRLAVGRAEEVKALQFVAQATNPQPPADAVPYTLTEEDLAADPSIAEQGFKAGDEVFIPKDSEPAKRKLKKSNIIMALVNQVDKKVRMTKWDIVKYQILVHCYLNNINVSEADLNCLTFLALEEDQELTSFCIKAHSKGIFSSTQSVRNCLTKAEKKRLIVKEGKNKKKIFINPEIKIFSKGNILLDYKFLSVETQES